MPVLDVKGQCSVHCANSLINATRFLRKKKIIGKHSGTNNLPSSFAQHFGPDKDQHLKPIIEAY